VIAVMAHIILSLPLHVRQSSSDGAAQQVNAQKDFEDHHCEFSAQMSSVTED